MKSIINNLKYDFPAGIIVFLVAVPLCLGIALASGVPLFSGIIAGIIGGIVVGVISHSPLGVSGPAAGLVVIILSAISDLGSLEAFLLAVVIGGVIQVILGFAKAGIIAYYFPSSVIKGMLTSIGIIIFFKQIPHAFGYDKNYEGDISFLQSDGQNTFSEIINMLNFISPAATFITVLSVVILILWERPFIRRIKLFQILQGPLVVVIVGILSSLFFKGTILEIDQRHLVSLPLISEIGGFSNLFVTPDFSQFTNPKIYSVALTIAIVASIETLLCLEATDKLDPQKRVTPTNRELKAQGVGNILSGLIGGLPITQVIVRSSTNIMSGGRTKISTIIHGFVLLASVMLIPSILNLIPLASLAAILFFVGYKLAKPSIFKEVYKSGKINFIPFIITIISILFTDLLVGVGIGMVVAIMEILYANYKRPFYLERKSSEDEGVIKISLPENVSFLNKANIQRELNKTPSKSKIIIDTSRCNNIHPDIIEIIEEFKIHAKYEEIDLKLISGEGKKIS